MIALRGLSAVAAPPPPFDPILRSIYVQEKESFRRKLRKATREEEREEEE